MTESETLRLQEEVRKQMMRRVVMRRVVDQVYEQVYTLRRMILYSQITLVVRDDMLGADIMVMDALHNDFSYHD